jgi:hypothetical protein
VAKSAEPAASNNGAAPHSNPGEQKAALREPSVLDDVLSGALRLKSEVFGEPGSGGSGTSRQGGADPMHSMDTVPGVSGGSGGSGGYGSSASRQEESGNRLLNNPIIRYIREHRGLTFAVCVGLAVAIYLATMWPTWRRRR